MDYTSPYRGHIGIQYPYYSETVPEKMSLSLAEIMQDIPVDERILDPAAVIEMVIQTYPLGERTLTKGISRVPWLGDSFHDGKRTYYPPPKHGKARPAIEDIVSEMRRALHREALKYIGQATCIGILLSGGLDSRVAAGIIRELQLTGDYLGEVIAITWGKPQSRDVAYASEIARRYHWEWVHFPVTAEQLLENIYVNGRMGAEFAPYHLHAMPRVRDVAGLDLILAGSYGDSVGRAEFSGRHVLKLKPIMRWRHDFYGILSCSVISEHRSQMIQDAYSYRNHIEYEDDYACYEIEQQMHYMRRLITGAMTCIAERIPVYQLFTDPETVSIMWGIDPAIRDNRYYELLLPSLPENISNIPWTRTGRCIGQSAGKERMDGLSKEFHTYGTWLRNDLYQEIKNLVLSDAILETNLFNEKALVDLLKIWPKARTITVNSLDHHLSWLASLAIFIRSYGIRSDTPADFGWRDMLKYRYSQVKAGIYLSLRDSLRE
jgi:hypothetical protein